LIGVYPNWLMTYLHQSIHQLMVFAYKTKI